MSLTHAVCRLTISIALIPTINGCASSHDRPSTTPATHPSGFVYWPTTVPTVQDFVDGQFLEAIRAGADVATLSKMIRDGADVNAVDEHGMAAIVVAVWQGHLPTVKLLIDHGASTRRMGSKSASPLIWACVEKDPDIAMFLIERGADLLAADERGSTALHFATYGPMEEVVEAMLKAGVSADIRNRSGETPLHTLAFYGGPHDDHTLAIAKVLLAHGADVNARDFREGVTPIHLAALKGDLELVKFLADNGADINAKALNGKTPLDWAVSEHQPEIEAFLIAHGAVRGIADDKTP